MNISSVASLPSDPDITVMLVKKKLDETQSAKGGDGKHVNGNISLINLVTRDHCAVDTAHPLSSDTSSAHTTHWDQDGNGRSSPTKSFSYKTEELYTVNDSPRSERSVITIHTIQQAYAGSELTIASDCNREEFEEIDLIQSASIDTPTVGRENNNGWFKSCFPCIFGKKKDD